MVNPACPPWEPYPELKRKLEEKAKRTKGNYNQQVKEGCGKRAKNGSKRGGGGGRASQNPATDSSFNSFSSCSTSESSTASTHAPDGAHIASDWLLASPHSHDENGLQRHSAASLHSNTANRENDENRHHHHDHDGDHHHRDGPTTTSASRDNVHVCMRPESGACLRRGGCEGNGGCCAQGGAPGAKECEWKSNLPDLVLVSAGGDSKSMKTYNMLFRVQLLLGM